MRQFLKTGLARYCAIAAVAVFCAAGQLCATTPSNVEIEIGVQNAISTSVEPPYFYSELDSAGYSDWLWYGLSESHPYPYHEMLCGEWAAAIYYEGIATEKLDPNTPEVGSKAMWLTDQFIYPDWKTNSDFWVADTTLCSAWHEPNNPTPEINTGHTVIQNNEVEITVDYELVDLDEVESGARSPMTFRYPESSNAFYRFSDRYVILQTFTIRNLKTEDLEGLEFYQLLHAHPADEKSAAIYSIYETAVYADPLENYTPRNPVHQVGNFHYDMTQWNDINSNESSVNHVDFFSASTTIEPDVFGHGLFEGHSAIKPPIGTHLDIENRSLNSQVYLFDTEPAAGAGWFFGTLAPDETVSITFALMFGYDNEINTTLYLNKTAELSSTDSCGVDPTVPENSQIEYTIEYGNPSSDPNEPNFTPTIQYAQLIDELPDEVNFVSATNLDIFTYDPVAHTCTWNIGTIAPDEYGQVSVTVNATTDALPGTKILNRVILTTELGTITASVRSPVCCWQGTNICYVDESATGNNTGLSWEDAYTDLQDAFDSSSSGCSSEIRVAKGHYNPINGSGPTPRSFLLVDGLNVYGGFPSGGGDWLDRDYLTNVTLMCGYYERSGTSSIVDANDITEGVVLDGFVIANGTSHGIACNNAENLEIKNCYIVNNAGSGIKCNGANPRISDCVICGNDGRGILCSDNPSYSSNPIITNNKIYYNKKSGIEIASASCNPKVTNNWIYLNGNTNTGGSGITIFDADEPIEIRNNTIWGNLFIGIEALEGVGPEIENCIVWNHPLDLVGCTALYSCYANAPEINGNISDDPDIAYSDPNDYHLSDNSPCIDAGNSWAVGVGELDLDGDERVFGSQVDIGADEYSCGKVISLADFDLNKKVDLDDYVYMAQNWLNSYGANDPNAMCDIAPDGGDYKIDILDLMEFTEDWAWSPCWLEYQINNWIHRDDYLQMLELIDSYCTEAGD